MIYVVGFHVKPIKGEKATIEFHRFFIRISDKIMVEQVVGRL